MTKEGIKLFIFPPILKSLQQANNGKMTEKVNQPYTDHNDVNVCSLFLFK